MARIQSVRVIRMDDLSRNETVPAWVSQLLQPLNEFIETVVSALRGNLSLTENISGENVELDFTHGVAKSVLAKSKRRVIGVIPLQTGSELLSAFGWEHMDNGEIGITVKFDGGDSSTSATCRFFLLTE